MVDSEDGKVYIYTDFEPFQSHQLFASFDQPNLRAALTLNVVAPKEWKVIGNELIQSVEDGPTSDEQVTHFKTTPKN